MSIPKWFTNLLSWLVIYVVIALIWIGAEYAFENIVHTSYVDSVVCGVLAAFVSRKMQD